MDLNTFWFIVIAVLFVGFFFLEGFDYGVGMLVPFLGHNDRERRVLVNSIGPFWDGNEVWMITAGGALFASFPYWYATLFSGAYIALTLLLLALIARGVSFEFRSKVENNTWRTVWDWVIAIASFLAALLWGVTVGNLMHGLAIAEDMNYYGGLLPLLNPFAILGGLVFVFLFLLHGATFLSLKTDGVIRERAEATAKKMWWPAAVLTVLLVVWTFLGGADTFKEPHGQIVAILGALVAAVALLLDGWFINKGQFGWGFVMGALTIAFAVVMVFAGMFPRVMISTIDPKFSLTIYNASSSAYTLKTMTIVAVILVPFVLAYQAWSYWTFRQRLTTKSELDY